MEAAKFDRLYALALDRLGGRAPGFGMPVLWHLALRRYEPALIELSQRLDCKRRLSHPFSTDGLAYRSYRLGHSVGAQNLTMACFNRGDLQGYRKWLAAAARLGDRDAAREVRRFELRLPHATAARIGRKRPVRRDER